MSTLELMDCGEAIMQTVADPDADMDTCAAAYWMAVRSRYGRDVNWPDVNAAIIKRWGRDGLVYIKNEAWKP